MSLSDRVRTSVFETDCTVKNLRLFILKPFLLNRNPFDVWSFSSWICAVKLRVRSSIPKYWITYLLYLCFLLTDFSGSITLKMR